MGSIPAELISKKCNFGRAYCTTNSVKVVKYVIWRAEEAEEAGEIMKRLGDGVKLTSKTNELSEQEFLVNKSLTLVTLELLLHAARSALGRV